MIVSIFLKSDLVLEDIVAEAKAELAEAEAEKLAEAEAAS